MYIIATVFLTVVLMTSSASQANSLKTNMKDSIVVSNRVVEIINKKEVSKIEYITDDNLIKSINERLSTGVLFAIGESSLSNVAKEQLAELAQTLVSNPTLLISIQGYSDNIGALKLNQELSEKRALVVAQFLISKNVHNKQLKAVVGENYIQSETYNFKAGGKDKNNCSCVHIILASIANKPFISKEVEKDSLNNKAIPESLRKLVEQVVRQPNKSKELEMEIDGLLVDETKTKAGKDFYDLFYKGWEAPEAAKNYSITISEKPFRLTSTLITVSINDNMVYQSVLQPRQDVIEAMSGDAISITLEYLSNYEEIMKQLNGEDLTGSGIY